MLLTPAFVVHFLSVKNLFVLAQVPLGLRLVTASILLVLLGSKLYSSLPQESNTNLELQGTSRFNSQGKCK